MGYSDIIWTNHATDQAEDRRLGKNQVMETILDPDKTYDRNDATAREKKFGSQTLTAIVKKNSEGNTILISCWIDPPNKNTKDSRKSLRYKELQKASSLKKLFLTLKSQIGL
jgi:hypothetical protein